MMILGIGTDMVDIVRMDQNIAEHGDKLAHKILSDSELLDYMASGSKSQFLASRFAAKEAVAKALGTGFRDGLSLKHIEVKKDPLGRPHIGVSERAQILMDTLGVSQTHLSLSHERGFALAFVILEGA